MAWALIVVTAVLPLAKGAPQSNSSSASTMQMTFGAGHEKLTMFAYDAGNISTQAERAAKFKHPPNRLGKHQPTFMIAMVELLPLCNHNMNFVISNNCFNFIDHQQGGARGGATLAGLSLSKR